MRVLQRFVENGAPPRFLVQDNDAGVHVQDLHTAGKLCQRLCPVGVASNSVS
jgi:hypothetical protein